MTHFQTWTYVYKAFARYSIGAKEDPVGAARYYLEVMTAALSIAEWRNLQLEPSAQWDIYGRDNGPCLLVTVIPMSHSVGHLLVLPVGWLLAEMVDVVVVMES